MEEKVFSFNEKLSFVMNFTREKLEEILLKKIENL
jgi:hypothetical protein